MSLAAGMAVPVAAAAPPAAAGGSGPDQGQPQLGKLRVTGKSRRRWPRLGASGVCVPACGVIARVCVDRELLEVRACQWGLKAESAHWHLLAGG